MKLTTNQSEINSVLKSFDINPQDYYLLFDSESLSVYVVWCTSASNAMRLVAEESCIDIDITNNHDWLSDEEIPPGYKPKEPLVCVRYILETN